ncbi:unnamed protein product [Bursaphelenchus okinawaensis]|uniref:Uncharacterized protein n=1 Tax=Bursaphelenchus okinawaensis TaxID=465554 RepID=A0A811KJD3_9BILA|nr:unnamed protein product [Bursaphelenchus okinawaensis]CAG9104936.1 unnamed protein product [Bursaphelenchus okinawaensis]
MFRPNRLLTAFLPKLKQIRTLKQIQTVTEGNLSVVSLVDVPEPTRKRVFDTKEHSCALCSIPKKITYKDVLILEQFMREDGTVLPMQLTGLCKKQQLILERCVMQAHWSGLFLDRTLPDFDRSGYKRFNRYWKDDRDMYKLESKLEPGSWYFIKRCPVEYSANDEFDWFVAARRINIGSWSKGVVEHYNTFNDSLIIRKDGTIFVKEARRNLVEQYECVFKSKEANGFIFFRLDLAYFYEGPIFSTVFWGSCVVSLITCAASFVLNVLWIIIRKISMWWINRSERISRVRTMVEAMEKYRQRQIDSLHDNYQKKVQTIRDNYHQQVEEIRQSYMKQADRFRDYRQAQMETMTQHLDNIRDNYNQQLGRIREYGSRRAEQLLESYERQLNRMRTFTLQHRLKLMRQYKVKQQYINRLLENIDNTNNVNVISENEQKIRAVLDLPQPDLPTQPPFSDRHLPASELQRSASFYSLPEFVLDDDDNAGFRKQFLPINFAELKENDRPSTSQHKSSGDINTKVSGDVSDVMHDVVNEIVEDSQPDSPLLGPSSSKNCKYTD